MRLRSASIFAAVLLGLVLATAMARAALGGSPAGTGARRGPAWLASGKVLRPAAFGQRLLLADWYWLEAVQYMGEQVQSKGDWAALYPLVDLVTDLDPRHGYAYQVAGSNLAGLAGRYGEAERILKKGMEALPGRWSLPFTYAVNKFFFEGDFAEAAKYARRAAEVGRRPHLALLATNLALATDDAAQYATAQGFLEEQIGIAVDPLLRAQLEQRLVKLRTYAVLLEVERAVAAYRAHHGSAPITLLALVADGLLPSLPSDPSGGTIEYDPSDGSVRSSAMGRREPVRNTAREERAR